MVVRRLELYFILGCMTFLLMVVFGIIGYKIHSQGVRIIRLERQVADLQDQSGYESIEFHYFRNTVDSMMTVAMDAAVDHETRLISLEKVYTEKAIIAKTGQPSKSRPH